MKTQVTRNVIGAAMFSLLCLALPAQAQRGGGGGEELKQLAAKPTPRTADGRPDLSGRWGGGDGGAGAGGASGFKDGVHTLIFGSVIEGVDPEKDAITADSGLHGEESRKQREARNAPEYKPELRAKREAMATDQNHHDPTAYSCQPHGVPRMGAPAFIVQQPDRVIFLYGSNPYSTFRMIPTDGRPHRSSAEVDQSGMGDPVGRWEGDTLVIETTGFDEDSTWFGRDGYFHSDAMKVTERFTRKGDTLEYQATVEDPKVLMKPFNMSPTPQVIRKGDPKAILYNSDYPCDIEVHDFRQYADRYNHL